MSIELTRIIDEPIKNSREKIDGNFQEIEESLNDVIADNSGEIEVGAWSYPTTIAALETDLGITLDYQTIYQGVSTSYDYQDVIDVLDSGKKCLYNLQLSDPTGTVNLARILDGEYDDIITSIAEQAAEDGRQIMLVIMHEFNSDDYSWAIYKSGNDPADFVPAFQHVVDLWRAAGANIQVVQWWNRENYNEDSTPFLTYYAGEDYVDIIAVSQYNRSGIDYTFWHSVEHLFNKWYVEVTKGTTKPIMFGEISTNDANGDKPGWIKNTFRKVKDKYPRVKYITWFLENKSGGKNWALNTQAEEDAFVEGFAYIKSEGRGEEHTESTVIGRNIIHPDSFTDITKWTQGGADQGTLALSSEIPPFADYGDNSISITDDGDAGSDFTNEFYQTKRGNGYRNGYNSGSQYVISFWAKASVAGMFTSCGMKQNESPNTTKGWKKLFLETDWRFYEFTVDTDTAATNWRIPNFRFGDNSVAGTVYLYGIKVERGQFATSLERRDRTPARTRAVSADTTLSYTDHTVIVDATAGAKTMTLPAAADNYGLILTIQKDDASSNAVIVDGNASETINGATTFSLLNRYEAITIQCNGTGWRIVSIYSTDSGIIANLSPANDDILQRKGGAWANRTIAQLIADLVDTDVTLAANSDTRIASQKATKAYVDGLVAGLLDYRGAYDASVNTFPASGGSGTAGAVMKGDTWVISVSGTLGGAVVHIGDTIIANVDTPGQTAGNWNSLNTNLSYVPEDVANKDTDTSLAANSDTKYASQKATKAYADAKVGDAIADGVTTVAPSQNAVFDALALKQAILRTLVSKTFTDTPYAVLTTDQVILVDASGGATTATLPTAVGVGGKTYTIKKTDSSVNAVIVATTSAQTIDGETTFSIEGQYDTITVISDGANWNII